MLCHLTIWVELIWCCLITFCSRGDRRQVCQRATLETFRWPDYCSKRHISSTAELARGLHQTKYSYSKITFHHLLLIETIKLWVWTSAYVLKAPVEDLKLFAREARLSLQLLQTFWSVPYSRQLQLILDTICRERAKTSESSVFTV